MSEAARRNTMTWMERCYPDLAADVASGKTDFSAAMLAAVRRATGAEPSFTDRLALYESALRTIQEAAAGYIHPERRVTAEQLIDVVLAEVDNRDLVKAMRTSERDSDMVGKDLEEGK